MFAETRPTGLRLQILSRLTRLYPFKSGCGAVSNSTAIRFLAGNTDYSVWTSIQGGEALVPLNDLVGRSMFFTGDLDPKVSWVIDRYTKPGDTVLAVSYTHLTLPTNREV